MFVPPPPPPPLSLFISSPLLHQLLVQYIIVVSLSFFLYFLPSFAPSVCFLLSRPRPALRDYHSLVLLFLSFLSTYFRSLAINRCTIRPNSIAIYTSYMFIYSRFLSLQAFFLPLWSLKINQSTNHSIY